MCVLALEMMLRRKHGGGMPAEKRSRREREKGETGS